MSRAELYLVTESGSSKYSIGNEKEYVLSFERLQQNFEIPGILKCLQPASNLTAVKMQISKL